MSDLAREITPVNIEEELIYKNTGWAVKLYESLLLGVYRRPPERQEDT